MEFPGILLPVAFASIACQQAKQRGVKEANLGHWMVHMHTWGIPLGRFINSWEDLLFGGRAMEDCEFRLGSARGSEEALKIWQLGVDLVWPGNIWTSEVCVWQRTGQMVRKKKKKMVDKECKSDTLTVGCNIWSKRECNIFSVNMLKLYWCLPRWWDKGEETFTLKLTRGQEMKA